MTAGVERARKRCVATLGIVHREGVALLFSVNKLRGFPISPTWVAGLNENMDEAETFWTTLPSPKGWVGWTMRRNG